MLTTSNYWRHELFTLSLKGLFKKLHETALFVDVRQNLTVEEVNLTTENQLDIKEQIGQNDCDFNDSLLFNLSGPTPLFVFFLTFCEFISFQSYSNSIF